MNILVYLIFIWLYFHTQTYGDEKKKCSFTILKLKVSLIETPQYYGYLQKFIIP